MVGSDGKEICLLQCGRPGFDPLGWEDPLQKGMATDSSILAWRIPMDREAWRGTVRGVPKSDATEQLSTAQKVKAIFF